MKIDVGFSYNSERALYLHSELQSELQSANHCKTKRSRNALVVNPHYLIFVHNLGSRQNLSQQERETSK